MNDLLTKRKVTFSSKRVLIAILLLFIGLGDKKPLPRIKVLLQVLLATQNKSHWLV